MLRNVSRLKQFSLKLPQNDIFLYCTLNSKIKKRPVNLLILKVSVPFTLGHVCNENWV